MTGEPNQHTRRTFLRGTGAVAAIGASALAGGTLVSGTASAAVATARRGAPPSLAQLAQDAVIFGLPAVLQSRYLALSEAAGFARNQFAVNLELSTPETHVAGPNDDTLYGFTYLDLTDGPQVIEVPATPGRYFSIQLIDFWTNAFGYIGTRTTGSAAGAFAITPPGWHGRLPHGVRQVRATTKRLLALLRTEVKNPADLAAAQAIQTSYTTGPLPQYPRQRVSPVVAAQALNIFAPLPLTGFGTSLFEEINSLIQEYPPLPRDAEYARRLRPVGVDVHRYQQPGALLAGVLQAAIPPAIEAIEAGAPALLSETSTGWSVNYHVTPVTHDPLKRAALAIYGPGTHVNKEALYFSAAAVDGVTLTGTNEYTLTFPAGQLPPAGAFWSVILYDATTFWLVANPIDRSEIASHTGDLSYNADGSLTIAVSNTPATDPTVNWLPSPTDAFRLILRTYLPAPSILDGTWIPPTLLRSS
jgi:hypothetical protein